MALVFRTTPMVSIDVDPSCFHSLAEALTDLVEEQPISSSLRAVHFCPIVLKGDIYSCADFQNYKRGEGALLIGRNISHPTWRKASMERRLALAVANFKLSIDAIPGRYMVVGERDRLKEFVERAVQALP